jgi:hypothetical protein
MACGTSGEGESHGYAGFTVVELFFFSEVLASRRRFMTIGARGSMDQVYFIDFLFAYLDFNLNF